MQPRVLVELRRARHDEKKNDSADNYGLKTKDCGADKNSEKTEYP